MPLRRSGLIALLLVLGLVELGQAQIIIVGQDRRVSSSAFVVLEGDSDTDQSSAVAPDTGPFDTLEISTATIVGGEASAEGSQTSLFTQSSIQGSGAVSGQATVAEGGTAYAAASSNIAVSFMVEFPRAYNLQGFVEESGNGTATVQLSRPFETLAWFAADDGTVPFEAAGFLEPGTYSLNVTTSGGAVADPSGTGAGAASYDVSLLLSSPTDVPAGPVLADALQVSPNPFRTSTRLTVPDGVRAVRILDAAGRVVRTLTGDGTLTWDGRGEAGRPLASGVYWLRPVGPASVETVKVVRLN